VRMLACYVPLRPMPTSSWAIWWAMFAMSSLRAASPDGRLGAVLCRACGRRRERCRDTGVIGEAGASIAGVARAARENTHALGAGTNQAELARKKRQRR